MNFRRLGYARRSLRVLALAAATRLTLLPADDRRSVISEDARARARARSRRRLLLILALRLMTPREFIHKACFNYALRRATQSALSILGTRSRPRVIRHFTRLRIALARIPHPSLALLLLGIACE